MKDLKMIPRLILTLLFLWIIPKSSSAQIGPVIWEDNFNTFNTAIWTADIGDGCDIGLCGWGNAELQYYNDNNITIEDVPGEPGNKALVLEARYENLGTRAFTSGKIVSDGKLSIQYGMIEVRMRVPNLETGLWPAAWLLGTTNLSWPAIGEIDMMEMGHAQSSRTTQGFPSSTVNNYVGANAIFAVPDGSPGSIAFDVDYNQPYVSSTPLNDRFITYRLYWEPTQMRYTVIDQGVENDLYTGPLPLDPDGVTGAFTKPFYMLLNLAVGGNFTDALTNGQVSASLPAKMYVDYVRVHEWNGYGEVAFNYEQLASESGVFGVFTDNTVTNNQLTFGSDGEIYAWGGTVTDDPTTLPFEGDNIIAWQTTSSNGWFGGGITSLFGKDMSGYVDNGSLKFKIKIPANVSFRIGITDNFTNESYVDFPANATIYGLVRDGEWGLVEIPIADFAGLIAFQDIGYLFTITSDPVNLPSAIFNFAVDDVVWDDGNNFVPVLTNIVVSPGQTIINEGESVLFSAQGFDQQGNAMPVNVNWSATGGSVNAAGIYQGSAPGSFIITASSGSVSGNAAVTVNAVTTASIIPGRIEAEDYNEGGNNVGYFDTSVSNIGGAYRTDRVDIQNTGDVSGDFNIGWIAAGEWLEYDINVQGAVNNFDFVMRVASPNGNGRLHLEIDGVDVSGTLSVPNTGNWQNYVDLVAQNITISAGSHVLRVAFEASGLNLNYIEGIAVPTNNNNCQGSAQNGDYTYMISGGNAPALTFNPSTTEGSTVCILYYGTSANGSYPGYLVTPGQPFALNGVNNGETVYFYYTYSIPGGGERNTNASRHDFEVGNCGNNARTDAGFISDDELTGEEVLSVEIYPNPANHLVMVALNGFESDYLELTDISGKVIKHIEIKGEHKKQVDLSDVTPGNYILIVRGDGQAFHKKLVKR